MIKTKEDMVKYIREHNISENRVFVLAKNADWLRENLITFMGNMQKLTDGHLYKAKWYFKEITKLVNDVFKKMTSICLEIPENELSSDIEDENMLITPGTSTTPNKAKVNMPKWVNFFTADKKEMFSEEAMEEVMTREQVDNIMNTCKPYVEEYVVATATLFAKATYEFLNIPSWVSEESSFVEEKERKCYKVSLGKRDNSSKPKSKKDILVEEITRIFQKSPGDNIFNRIV